MKVILRKTVEKLGNPGDAVDIKEGYARNFLIPRGLALPATEAAIKRVEAEKRREIVRKQKESESAKGLAEKLAATSLTVPVDVGEGDKLFGSVTSMDIAKALEQEQIKVDRHDISLDEPIKELGVYTVQVRLHPEVQAAVKVWVIKK